MAVLPSTSGFPGCGHFFDIRDIPKIDEDVFRLVGEDVVVLGRKCPFKFPKGVSYSYPPPQSWMDAKHHGWMPNTMDGCQTLCFFLLKSLLKKNILAEYATTALFSGDTWRVKYDENHPEICGSVSSIQANDRPFRVARWWFQLFSISPLLGKMIQFDSYVSKGLVQPPTRLTMMNIIP